MKINQSIILNTYSTYIVSSYNTITSNIYPNTLKTESYNIYVDDNTRINTLMRAVEFKSDLITFNLLNNKDLLNCLTETVNILSNAGVMFYAHLDLIYDDDEPKFLLVYYPVNKPLNTYLTSFENKTNDKFDLLYSSVIRNLYKYPISIKKKVLIDEQPI